MAIPADAKSAGTTRAFRYTRAIAFGQVGATLLVLLTACGGDQEPAPPAVDGPVVSTKPAKKSAEKADPKGPFTCLHHPLVVTDDPSTCPHCKMDLVPQEGTGVFICTEHFEAVDVRPGRCRVCDKLLVSAPLGRVWRCARHPEILEEAAGACPVCETQLKEAPVGEAWVCPAKHLESLGPDRESTAVGTLRLDGGPLGFATEEVAFRQGNCQSCGRALVRVTLGLPHGDHNPRYGGQFRMASDYWHHIELVLPEPGVLRLYFYDNYTRPLGAAGFDARVFRSRMDPKSGLIDGTTPFAFASVEGEPYLETKLDAFELPLLVLLKVRLGGRDERFDFAFRELAKPTSDPDDGTPLVSRVSDDEAIPSSPVDIVVEIIVQDLRLQQRIARQEYDAAYIPAFRAKVLALALEERIPEDDDAERRRAIDRAVRDVVRGAWLVDFHGDQGDRRELLEHYRTFAGGVTALRRLFPLLPETARSPRRGAAPEDNPPREENSPSKKEAFR
jgi:hypothetical protein